MLSIATSHHIGLHRLPPVLRDFSKRYPEVELKLGFMDSEQACQQILNGETELAIVTLPDEENDRLDTIPVWHDPLYIVVARQHPLSSQKRVSIHQLQAYPAILPSTGTYTRKLIDNALGLEGPVRTLLETHYLETIKAMVKTGLGWSMLPASMLDQGLSVLNIKRIQTIRQLGIIVHSMRTKSNAANAMIDQLLNYADGE